MALTRRTALARQAEPGQPSGLRRPPPAPRPPRNGRVVALVVGAVLALAVAVGTVVQGNERDRVANTVISASSLATESSYPVELDKGTGTVRVGREDAEVSIDIYEDFLCPVCGQFEKQYFTAIERQLEAGRIKVEYHMLDLLDPLSDPPGYSQRAANVALAVAATDPRKFMDFHYSLLRTQPKEGSAGWTDGQLLDLAERLQVPVDDVTALGDAGRYDDRIHANSARAAADKSLWQGTGSGKAFGTPTVVSGDRIIPWQQDTSWLRRLVGSD
ncbi:DsbA family protein [Streptomyces sp. NPDC058307]|uniref:DsbA family protein n=1 Tax=Streptomyces sp. NPDC058307 TaxID=3346439 RepID=UPI0036EFBEA3